MDTKSNHNGAHATSHRESRRTMRVPKDIRIPSGVRRESPIKAIYLERYNGNGTPDSGTWRVVGVTFDGNRGKIGKHFSDGQDEDHVVYHPRFSSSTCCDIGTPDKPGHTAIHVRNWLRAQNVRLSAQS